MFWHRRPQAKGYPYLRLRLAFEAGFGLCLHHALRARALFAPGEARRINAVVTRERLAVPGWELEEQRRKVSWSHRPEERGTELGAWRRAVARISGTVADDGP